MKGGALPDNAVFDASVVYLPDIDEKAQYCGGSSFVPSITAYYCETARQTAAADAAHFEGIGPKSYGRVFDVVTYDASYHLLPLVSAHSV